MPKKVTTSKFIGKAIRIHKGKYNYSLVEYIHSRKKVQIICYKHGIFEQKPDDHLSGHGCSKCGGNNKHTNKSFIEKAMNIHKGKYNYNKVCYVNNEKKVNIECYTHGMFLQRPRHHLSGQGCPICGESKGEKELSELLDKFGIEYTREFKFNDCIGVSRALPFDFYLHKHNTCIEYDGVMHFKPVFGERRFNERKVTDDTKTKYCKDNNINLIRIPYTKYNSMEDIIKDKLL